MSNDQADFAGSDPAIEAVRALARLARAVERASSELSLAHYRVLSAVAAGEERASRVAERLQLGRPAVSAAVEALGRAGYFERVETLSDRRAFDLRLTPAGEELLRRVEAAMAELVSELCGETPDGQSILAGLASLNRTLDDRLARRVSACTHATATEAS